MSAKRCSTAFGSTATPANSTMKKILPKIVALILTLAAIGLGLWLGNKKFPAPQQRVVAAEVGREAPMLSSLGPTPRLTLDYPHQLILDSPVYFNLRSL